MNLTLFAVIPTVTAALGVAAGYVACLYIRRNDKHVEVADLRIALHDHQNRIYEVNQQLNEAYDKYEQLNRSHKQLETDFRVTTQHYAQCDADRIVAEGFATNYADQLRTFGIDPDADWTEQPAENEQPDAVAEVADVPLWNDVTGMHPITEYREESPTEWLNRAQVEAARKASAEIEKRRRVPAARKPSGQS